MNYTQVYDFVFMARMSGRPFFYFIVGNVWLYDFVAFRNELYNVLQTVKLKFQGWQKKYYGLVVE